MKVLLRKKGGPTSGFHDHTGLAGVWGGSTSRSDVAVTIGSQPEDVTGLHQQIIKSGGFTYEPLTNDSPTEGFAVSGHKDREAIFDAKTFSKKNIIRFINKNAKLLAKPRTHLGAWFNKEDGKIYLDFICFD